jgi:hypothetical protein
VAVRENGQVVVKPILEACLDAAIYMGWDVIACDSEIPYVPRVFTVEPSQSNPRRAEDA